MLVTKREWRRVNGKKTLTIWEVGKLLRFAKREQKAKKEINKGQNRGQLKKNEEGEKK